MEGKEAQERDEIKRQAKLSFTQKIGYASGANTVHNYASGRDRKYYVIE